VTYNVAGAQIYCVWPVECVTSADSISEYTYQRQSKCLRVQMGCNLYHLFDAAVSLSLSGVRTLSWLSWWWYSWSAVCVGGVQSPQAVSPFFPSLL
jgi:hypothetical protein